jgi:hypothetical protein
VSALRVGDEELVGARPGPLSLALVASGARCVVVYVVLPALGPVVGALTVVWVPVVLGLYALGIILSCRALRRGVTNRRWAAAMLAAVLLLLNLASVLVVVG